MPLVRYARGLWARFTGTENPFSTTSPSMEDNLRLIDDHLGLYTLQPPQAPGTPKPNSPIPGDGQIYTDGTYAVFNDGSWTTYQPRLGVRAVLATGTESWLCTGAGWGQFSVVDTGPAVAAATSAVNTTVQSLVDQSSANAQLAASYAAQTLAMTNSRPSISIALADEAIPVGGSFTAPLADGSFQSYTKTSTTVATPFGAPFTSKAAVDAVMGLIPSIGSWFDLTVDSSNRPVRGTMIDGTIWEARSGVLVQVARAPLQPAGVPTYDALKVIGTLDAAGISQNVPMQQAWVELYLDSTNRPVRGLRVDGTAWEVRLGVWMQIQSPLGTVAALQVGALTTSSLTVTDALTGPGVFQVSPTQSYWRELDVDSTGRPVGGRRFDGRQFVVQAGVWVDITPASAATVAGAHSYAYDYMTGTAFISDADTDYLIIINGQSWAQGGWAGDGDDATVTTSAQHPGAALMFNPGVRPGGAAVSSYVDLHEQYMGGSYESPASGMADIIMSNLQSRLGFKPRIVFCSATYGGQGYSDATNAGSGLKRGTATYAEALRLVTNAVAISKQAGRKLIVLAQVVIHGEQDFNNGLPKALYQRALDQWQAHFDQDVRAITGQADLVRMYVTQVNRGYGVIGSPALTALAQLAAEDRNPRIRCCGPLYQGPSGSDGAHLRALGYRMIGRLVGKFILEDMFGPYEQPLRVIESYWVSSTVARLRYSKQVTIETTDTLINTTNLGADKGIKFTDGSSTPPTVSSVAIASGTTDTLEITLSSAPAGKHPRLTIAAYRLGYNGSGATTGARSAIRSTTSIDTDALTGVTQYHWACQEQISLPPI